MFDVIGREPHADADNAYLTFGEGWEVSEGYGTRYLSGRDFPVYDDSADITAQDVDTLLSYFYCDPAVRDLG